jgi:hypothetical protein
MKTDKKVVEMRGLSERKRRNQNCDRRPKYRDH